ncbi:MAG TPA: pitrilysin family protein [Blastocatellia bacterium]|nr:pitrilysin family protein [Blastocatellia bacterium]
MKIVARLLPALATIIILCAVAPAQQLQIKTHTLKNGMKIIIEEDHSIPNVALYVFYRIGSRNERPGTTGLSHFFEHMMFNGAKKYGPKQFDVVMEANGGANNAYTSRDVTVYQDWFPRSALDLIFDLEADRIADLSFDPKVIESERGVVASERRTSIDASNFGILYEQLFATAYTAHPYQWPVVGWMVDIENWKPEDLKRHFEMGYSPSNATMVMSGDVSPEEIVKLAEKYIEPIQIGNLGIARNNPDRVYIRVVNTLFGGRFTSMLNDALRVSSGLTYGASSSFAQNRARGQFVISTFTRNETTEKAIDMTLDILKKLREQGISEADLKSAKAYIKGQFPPQIETTDQLATQIAQLEFYGFDEREINDFYAKIDAMTMEDARRVIKQYFPQDDLVFVLIGKASEIENVAKKYAPKLDTKSINQPGF